LVLINRIILKLISQKYDVTVWTTFISSWRGNSSEHSTETLVPEREVLLDGMCNCKLLKQEVAPNMQ